MIIYPGVSELTQMTSVVYTGHSSEPRHLEVVAMGDLWLTIDNHL